MLGLLDTWGGRLSWSPPPSIVSSPASILNKIIRGGEGGGRSYTLDKTKRNICPLVTQSVIERVRGLQAGIGPRVGK